MTDLLLANKIDFENFILNESYYLTIFDFLLISKKYTIPIIFIFSKPFYQVDPFHNFYITNGKDEDNFILVFIPPFQTNKLPKYKIILNDKNEIFIPIKELSGQCVDEIKNELNRIKTVDQFIKKYKKSKPLLIEEDDEDKVDILNIKSKLTKERKIDINPIEKNEFDKNKTKKRYSNKGNTKTKKILIEED